MGVLLNEGIGDTIRVSLMPRPGGDRREEVYAACELPQSLGLRSFSRASPLAWLRTHVRHVPELAERIQTTSATAGWKTTHKAWKR
jgi:(E)-4-hydroxy-3-methylbut-2-enyl-diphosphate synthase